MCFRFCLREPADLARIHGIDHSFGRQSPRYHISPEDVVTAIFDDRPQLADTALWGIPVQDPGTDAQPHRYRLKTDDVFPPSGGPFTKMRRCLIPADGYYEWLENDRNDFPELFTLRGDGLFLFAGVWSEPPGGAGPRGCALLMTRSNSLAAEVSSEMPVILPQPDAQAWLAAETPAGRLQEMLRPFPSELMRRRPVPCRMSRNAQTVDRPARAA